MTRPSDLGGLIPTVSLSHLPGLPQWRYELRDRRGRLWALGYARSEDEARQGVGLVLAARPPQKRPRPWWYGSRGGRK